MIFKFHTDRGKTFEFEAQDEREASKIAAERWYNVAGSLWTSDSHIWAQEATREEYTLTYDEPENWNPNTNAR